MPAGRPTVMTEEVIRKLEDAFVWGCTDLEACAYADISPSSLYLYQSENEEFSERKEMLKGSIRMRAKRVISASIDDNDLNSAHRVIERAEGKKVNLAGADGNGPVEIRAVEYVIKDSESSSS